MNTSIFEKSRAGRRAFAQAPRDSAGVDIPKSFLRQDKAQLPEASELQVVRHFTRLSQKNVVRPAVRTRALSATA